MQKLDRRATLTDVYTTSRRDGSTLAILDRLMLFDSVGIESNSLAPAAPLQADTSAI
jgi:hypothetical protein